MDRARPLSPAPRVVKKPDVLDAVVARTHLKRREIKPALDAALAVIGDALQDGEEVNIPPLGKLRVVKAKVLASGATVMTVKLRTPKHASAAASGVAPDGAAD